MNVAMREPLPFESAEDYGMFLACSVPMNQLPPKAIYRDRENCSRYGMCGEVMIDSYVEYAKYDLNLPNKETAEKRKMEANAGVLGEGI